MSKNPKTTKTRQTLSKKRKMYKRLSTLFMLLAVLCVMYGFKDSIKSWVLRGEVESEVTSTLEDALNTPHPESKVNAKTTWKQPDKEHVPVVDREDNTKEYASKGVFIIPKIEETLAIMDGVGGNNMYRGAGEQFLDQSMGVGNYVLSSHRMYDGSLFADLEQVSVGDEVYVTDYQTVWKYRVTESDNHVKTTQTQLLTDTSEPVLTFYGCTSDGKMRVVKRAELVGYAHINDLGEEDKQLINTK